MSFFKRSKRHEIPQECIYDPYLDLESEIVGKVYSILKKEDLADEMPDYEKELLNNEDERKHLLKLFEIAQGCDIDEIACFLMVARKEYPVLWHIVNAKADKDMREKLEEFENIGRGKSDE